MQLQASEAAREEVTVENAALRARMEGMVVEMLSVKADASVLGQAAGAAEIEARRLQREAHQLSQQLAARTTEAAELRAQLQKLTSATPGGQAAKLERTERLLAERAEAMAAGAKREAAANQEKEAAQNLARWGRLPIVLYLCSMAAAVRAMGRSHAPAHPRSGNAANIV